MIKGGLLKLPEDVRDYKLGEAVTYEKLEDLPTSFVLGTPTIMDQEADGNEDYCTGYATCGASEFQDGVKLYPPFVFAASRPSGWGQDLRTMMKTWASAGCCETKIVPQDIKNKPESERRNIDTYPQFLQVNALDYIKPTYFSVINGQYDAYDDIRASIWHFHKQGKAQPVISGLNWHWPIEQYILNDVGEYGSGHCIYYIGWDADGLICVNSYGEKAGKGGIHRVSRETVNKWAGLYGAYTMTDISQVEARALLKKKLSLMEQILLLMKKLLNLLK